MSAIEASGAGHVFSVFRQYVEYFLEQIESSLPAYLLGGVSQSESKDRWKAIRGLDQLATYLRFYETGLSRTVPAATRDHAQKLWGSMGSPDLILLRPQNEQTFDTRLYDASLRSTLEVMLDYFVHISRDLKRANRIKRHFERLPNVYTISYPKYLGHFVLLFPAFGHEFGHVLFDTLGLEKRQHVLATKEVQKFEASRPTALAFEESLAFLALVKNWSFELFCDAIAWHLYGEAYIYTLWVTLAAYPVSFETEAYREYVRTYLPSRSGAASHRVEPESDIRLGYRHYPSPGRRLRALLAKHAATLAPALPGMLAFESWRNSFKNTYEHFEEQFADTEYEAAFQSASRIAERLYSQQARSLDEPAASALSTRAASMAEIVSLAKSRIPPCQVGTTSGLRPVDWREFVFGAWIFFVEQSALPEPDASPSEIADFLYQSFDMADIYNSYYAVRNSSDGNQQDSAPTEDRRP